MDDQPDAGNSFEVGWHAPLRLALGLEYRRDTYEIRPGEEASYVWGPYRVLDGPAAGTVPTIGSQGFAGIQPGDAGDYSRHNVAAYVEADTDVTERLLVSLAGRWEDYSDFGSTTNGKLALRYQLGGGVALRASASTGFHAPALAQQYFSSTSSRTLNNAVTGLPEYVLVRTAPVDSVEARALGARDLDPEKATNLTAGLTWGIAGLTASLDVYRIDIDDRIFLSTTSSTARAPRRSATTWPRWVRRASPACATSATPPTRAPPVWTRPRATCGNGRAATA